MKLVDQIYANIDLFKANLKAIGAKVRYDTDGCSGVPDINDEVVKCCESHDFIYRNPQLGISRWGADWGMFKCIKENHNLSTALLYWTGVRLIGWDFYKLSKKEYNKKHVFDEDENW